MLQTLPNLDTNRPLKGKPSLKVNMADQTSESEDKETSQAWGVLMLQIDPNN